MLVPSQSALRRLLLLAAIVLGGSGCSTTESLSSLEEEREPLVMLEDATAPSEEPAAIADEANKGDQPAESDVTPALVDSGPRGEDESQNAADGAGDGRSEGLSVAADATAAAAPSPLPPPASPAPADPAPAPAAVATPSDVIPDASPDATPEIVVAGRYRHQEIRDLMSEARGLLRNVRLQYVYTGKGRREVLRGRPVAFALWSEARSKWTIAHIEIPRPPIRWKPGRKPLPFLLRTPGVNARHVKGTGAERLMFAFTARDGEALKVYGRKFPVFEERLVKRRKWRAAVASAQPIVYLPFTADTLDAQFVNSGRDYLLSTARKALEELRAANALSMAFPGESLANVVPAEVIATLAVIEQTDDGDYLAKGAEAFQEVLSQYGLKREDAYRYSISRANAIGPMQFTNRRGNGTYSLVVRRCRAARLDPNFERGATNLLNAMKAAICLFDIELYQMPAYVRAAYRSNMKALGVFPVAAYNGGPKNVTKLSRVITRAGIALEDLRLPNDAAVANNVVPCPCLWKQTEGGLFAVSIPRYNNENRWYVQKYQSILRELERQAAERTAQAQ